MVDEFDERREPHFVVMPMTETPFVIYGTGRSGGPPGSPPRLFAVDKATGRDVFGCKIIPSRGALVWVNCSGEQTPIYLSVEDLIAA